MYKPVTLFDGLKFKSADDFANIVYSCIKYDVQSVEDLVERLNQPLPEALLSELTNYDVLRLRPVESFANLLYHIVKDIEGPEQFKEALKRKCSEEVVRALQERCNAQDG